MTPLSGWYGEPDEEDPACQHPFQTPEDKRYEMGLLLGWGGMGTVHTVQDLRLRREVAWKQGSDKRLPQEAWIAAQLEHPGIVPIYDAGRDHDGRPFYTMRLIRGRTLAAAILETETLDDRLRLLRHFLDTCQAMAFAHHAGVVHRDLKPSNIMVGEFGETQVVDWGVARPIHTLDVSEDEAAVVPNSHQAVTMAGAVVGTPAYMSPEQALGESTNPRADIWSLGVILFELIEGHPPFTGRDTDEVLQQLLHLPVPAITQNAPPDLIAIANRAMKRNPDERYANAESLAQDIEAWLDGRQVFAHTYTQGELLLRFIQAWRVPLTAGLLAGVAIAIAIATATVRIDRARIAAEAARTETQLALEVADQQLASTMAARSIDAFEKGITVEAELLAARALTLRESPHARGVLAGLNEPALTRISVRQPPCPQAKLTQSGRLTSCVEEDAVSFWDTDTNRLHLRVPGKFRDFATHWKARRLLTLVDRHDVESGLVRRYEIRDLDTGELLFSDIIHRHLTISGFSEDGVALLHEPHHVYTINGLTGELFHWNVCKTSALILSIRRKDRILNACTDGSWELIEASKNKRYVPPEANTWTAAAWIDDDRFVAAHQGSLSIMDLNSWEATWRFAEQKGRIQGLQSRNETMVAFSDQLAPLVIHQNRAFRLPQDIRHVRLHNNTLITLGNNGIERWRVHDESQDRLWHPAGISAIDLSPKGDLLSAANGSGRVQIWTTHGSPVATLQWQDRVVKAGVFSRDGTLFASSAMGAPKLVMFDTDTWTPRLSTPGVFRRIVPTGPDSFLATTWSKGSSRSISSSGEAHIRLKDLLIADTDASTHATVALAQDAVWMIHDTPEMLFPVSNGLGIALAEDGRIAISSRSDVSLWGPRGDLLATIDTRAIAHDWSPNGEWLAVGKLTGKIEIWSTDSPHLQAILSGHQERVSALKFSPDGEMLYSASWDGTVRRWSMDALQADPTSRLQQAEKRWRRKSEDALNATL